MRYIFLTLKGHRVKVTFAEWYENIRINFERCFWISKNIGDPDDRPDLINRRGIYKDSYGASSRWQDYQLRPNFPIAMVVVRGGIHWGHHRIDL